ncbi:hypothetical protein CRUP_006884 [Coryphaenoides rupestris]|nr:hypothetical protein CRUP_006884 [Coryphaenoides rupestris]
MAARTRVSLRSLLRQHAPTRTPPPPPPPPPCTRRWCRRLTAKSKSSLRHRYELRVAELRAAPGEEKLRLLTRVPRMKYAVLPQTEARSADRWYRYLTKTAYLPGLPEPYQDQDPPPPPGAGTLTPGGGGDGGADAAASAAASPSASASAPPPLPVVGEETLAEVRSLVSLALLQEQWYLQKRRPFLYRVQEHNVEPFLRKPGGRDSPLPGRAQPLRWLATRDLKPDVHFYWSRGQRIIPRGHRRGRVEPIRFQIDDKPHSQIRIPRQLPQFVPMESSYGLEVPEIKVSPDMMPLFKRQYQNHIFTGAKLADPARYGHTQFHVVQDRYHRDRLTKRGQADQVEVFLRAHGVCSLFCWTAAQAMYQGFWSRQDLTRPFVSQAVITDGQFFSFFCYQLNTLALSTEADVDNPRRNLLWGTESLRLYERVEDGRVVGLDDGVLRLLIQFLMNRPLDA